MPEGSRKVPRHSPHEVDPRPASRVRRRCRLHHRAHAGRSGGYHLRAPARWPHLGATATAPRAEPPGAGGHPRIARRSPSEAPERWRRPPLVQMGRSHVGAGGAALGSLSGRYPRDAG